jgi:hypothetical protein
MARASEGSGWNFVKVGGTYQYKEDGFIAFVTVLEDNSDDKYYRFKLQVERCNYEKPPQNGVFNISSIKELNGVYSGMLQLYEQPEYSVREYKWIRDEEKKS